MAIYDLYTSAIKSLSTGASGGPAHMVNISGDIWAMVCVGPDRDAWLYTVGITSSGSTIGTISPIIDSLELEDSITCYVPKIVHVSGTIYAIAYISDIANTLRLVTVNIENDGTITDTLVDGPDTIISGTGAQTLDFIKVASGMYAIICGIRLTSIGITDAGVIAPTTTDFLIVGTTTNIQVICHVSGDVYAILTQITGLDGLLATVTIDSAGAISGATIDTFTIAGRPARNMVEIASGIFTFIEGVNLHTIGIDSGGNIDADYTDTLALTAGGVTHWIAHITGDYYAIVWNKTSDGHIATIDIDAAGAIGAVLLSEMTFSTSLRYDPNLVLISSATTGLLIATAGIFGGGAFWIFAIGIGTWVIPTVTTQAVTAKSLGDVTGNGNLTVLGAPVPYQHGHCWNLTGTPTTSDNKTELGEKLVVGSFISGLTGLSSGVRYYIRSYAINMLGTVYGGQVEFITVIYYLNVKNLNLPYEDQDKTKELHIVLKNLSPTTKAKGTDGQVKVKIDYEPAA